MDDLADAVFDDVSIHDFEFPALTALDRCDRCSAAAVHRAVLYGEDDLVIGSLMFCGHHLRNHADALLDQGFWLF